MKNAVILSVIMVSVVMLSVAVQNVLVLSAVTLCYCAKCRSDKALDYLSRHFESSNIGSKRRRKN